MSKKARNKRAALVSAVLFQILLLLLLLAVLLCGSAGGRSGFSRERSRQKQSFTGVTAPAQRYLGHMLFPVIAQPPWTRAMLAKACGHQTLEKVQRIPHSLRLPLGPCSEPQLVAVRA